MSNEQLNQVKELIAAEAYTEASRLLQELLRQDPQNITAWLMYANLQTDPARRLKVLEACLRLNPSAIVISEQLAPASPVTSNTDPVTPASATVPASPPPQSSPATIPDFNERLPAYLIALAATASVMCICFAVAAAYLMSYSGAQFNPPTALAQLTQSIPTSITSKPLTATARATQSISASATSTVGRLPTSTPWPTPTVTPTDRVVGGRAGLLALCQESLDQSNQSGTPLLCMAGDEGDYISGGELRVHTPADKNFSTKFVGNSLSVRVEDWFLVFRGPYDLPLGPGEYTGADRAPFKEFENPGIDVGGNGRGCNRIKGSFEIISLLYDPQTLEVQQVLLTFEQHCEVGDKALYGLLRYGPSGNLEANAVIPTLTASPSPVAIPTADGSGITRIVYAATNEDSNWDIYTMNPDGSDPWQLTDSQARDLFPAWSPDGTQIVFSSDQPSTLGGPGGVLQLYVMNADGTNVRQLTASEGDKTDPAWSPDGKKIAYAAKVGYDQEIFIINADGSGQPINLTRDPTHGNAAPSWSPDGRRLVFASDFQLQIINADGSNPRPLTGGYNPAWSPQGDQIAFIDGPCHYNSLSFINTDGSGLVESDTAKGVVDPSWSPDGRYIVYGGCSSGLHVLDTQTSKVTTLVNDTLYENNESPAWQQP